MDSLLFRQTLSHYPTGVCAITASTGEDDHIALIVGSFTAVSLQPPLVGFFPARTSRRWLMIEQAGKFCVNILAADHQQLCQQIATQSSDPLATIAHRASGNGSPVLAEAVAWIDCDIDSIIETGDHFLVLGRVLDLGVAVEDGQMASPLLFFRNAYGCVATAADA